MDVPRAARALAPVPGNRPAVPRDWFRGVPERYVAGRACPACPELVSGSEAEVIPEDARKDGH